MGVVLNPKPFSKLHMQHPSKTYENNSSCSLLKLGVPEQQLNAIGVLFVIHSITFLAPILNRMQHLLLGMVVLMDYFESMLSQVVKDRPRIDGRPGTNLDDLDLDRLKIILEGKWGKGEISDWDVLSAALYPKVFDDYKAFIVKYGREIDRLPTRPFLTPLEEDEEVEVELNQGVVATMKYKAIGENNAPHHLRTYGHL